MKLIFSETGWKDYLHWQTQDRKTLKRINKILQDIERNGIGGIGKPEPLRGNLSGFHSRRIDDHNRIVFQLADGAVEIIQCRGHYGDA